MQGAVGGPSDTSCIGPHIDLLRDPPRRLHRGICRLVTPSMALGDGRGATVMEESRLPSSTVETRVEEYTRSS